MNAWTAFGSAGVFSLALWAQQASQTPPAQPNPPQRVETSDEHTRIVLDVTRVNMLFSVTDKKGRFITDLTKEDFEVIEGKRPQSIAEFTAEPALPLRLGILID